MNMWRLCFVFLSITVQVAHVQGSLRETTHLFCNEAVNTTESCCIEICSSLSCNTTCPDWMRAISINVTSTSCYSNTSSTTTPAVNTTNTERVDVYSLCVLNCPKGYYLRDDICLECDPECAKCTGKGSDTSVCTECKYFVYNNTCIESCPEGMYGDINKICQKCNILCRTCEGAGPDTSVSKCVCKNHRYNSTCVESCPNHTQPDKNGLMCVEPQDDEGNNMTTIIAGGAAGGAVLIVCIVIAVVCICKRRRSRSNTRRPISILADDRRNKNIEEEENDPNNVENIALPRKKKPVSYENIGTHDGTRLAVAAQQEEDKRTRYKRDPTSRSPSQLKKKKNEQVRGSGVYVNEEIVRAHKKFGDNVEQRNVKSKSKGPMAKFKKSVKKKLMGQKTSSTEVLQGKSSSSAAPEGEAKSGYADMTGDQLENYEPLQHGGPDSGDTQEEYIEMEVSGTAKCEGARVPGASASSSSQVEGDMPEEDYMNNEQIREATLGSHGVSKSSEDDIPQEDYMNQEEVRRLSNLNDTPLEDYENQETIIAATNPGFKDDEQEDYENWQPLYENVDTLTRRK